MLTGSGTRPIWTRLAVTAAPPERDGHVAEYDAAHNRMIIFGGDSDTPTGFPPI
jgi:hypothetical protein